MRSLLIASTSLCLLISSGCTPAIKVRPAKPITITVIKYVPLDPAMTVPCAKPVPWASLNTWGDLAQSKVTEDAALVNCADKLESIRKIQPATKKTADKPT